MTASTMSTAFSSAADVEAGGPPGWTLADGGATEPSPPTSERKSIPVAQLRTRTSRRPPIPRPPARIPMPPELARASSILLRSPLVHFMAASNHDASASAHENAVDGSASLSIEDLRRLDAGYEFSVPTKDYSTTMVRHFACLNLVTVRTQRVRCPRRMAVHTPDVERCPVACRVAQRPIGTTICETSVM